MQRIDSHQHFWKYDAVRDHWMTDEMDVIRQDFLPDDLQPILQNNNIDGCVTVQASQTEAENTFLLDLAARYPFIRGIVGWVDLQADDLPERLWYYSTQPTLKGFRHVFQSEPRRDLMLTPAFKRGIRSLQQFGYTYDILIYPDQISYSRELIATFPEQKFVIDHLAKPYIKEGKIDEWRADIQAIARYPNTWCKLSGFVTEADWEGWKKQDFDPYFGVVMDAFGVNRVLFGSDWPVCQLTASYSEVLEVLKDYFSAFSQKEQDKIFGGNAITFYNL